MKLRHLFLTLSLAPGMLHAATEFEGGLVPVELLRQLTGGAIYRSLPDGFPVVSLPAGTDVRLLGSMQVGSTRDALLTTQNVGALYQALLSAYLAAGWTNFNPASSAENALLCHERQGYLSIVRPTPTYNGLRLTHSAAALPAGQTCATIASQSATNWLNYFFGLMPTFTPPPQTRPSTTLAYGLSLRAGRYTSAGGGTVVLEYSREIEVPNINIAGLYAHFAARLGEQNWWIDSEDTGVKSASAILYKTAAPPANITAGDTQLTGFFSIVNVGGDQYRLAFTVEATTDGDFSLSGLFSVPFNVLGTGPLSNDPRLGIRGIPSGYTVR